MGLCLLCSPPSIIGPCVAGGAMPYVVGAPAVAARLFGLVDNDMGKGTVREEWQQVHIGGQSV